MASENLELVRSILVDWEGGNYSSNGWADPEIELVIVDGPAPGRWRGLAEMARGWREFLSAWEEWTIEVEEYRELDHERVLVLAHFKGRGKTSGLELAQMRTRGANLLHLREGKVTTLGIYWDRGRALADLGLPPEDGGPTAS